MYIWFLKIHKINLKFIFLIANSLSLSFTNALGKVGCINIQAEGPPGRGGLNL